MKPMTDTEKQGLIKKLEGQLVIRDRMKKKTLKLAVKHPDNSEVQEFKKKMIG